jgi:hypothetical protein
MKTTQPPPPEDTPIPYAPTYLATHRHERRQAVAAYFADMLVYGENVKDVSPDALTFLLALSGNGEVTAQHRKWVDIWSHSFDPELREHALEAAELLAEDE